QKMLDFELDYFYGRQSTIEGLNCVFYFIRIIIRIFKLRSEKGAWVASYQYYVSSVCKKYFCDYINNQFPIKKRRNRYVTIIRLEKPNTFLKIL
ncbi:MAG: hypothetical protein QXT80_03590, partial [Thermoplasmatales archaeon]